MKIYTFSIIYNTFESYEDKLPYVVAIVEDEQGARFGAYVENYQEGMEVHVGDSVECVGTGETGSLICRFI